jgi:hypothetical protein
MMTHWAEWLAAGGMWNELLESRKRAGVAIADLTLTGEDDSELIVRFLSEGRAREEAERVLCTWARRVGYRRMWFPDRVVTLDGPSEIVSSAEVRCRVCGSRWHDSTPDFWEIVRNQGSFPKWCFICGWELPQWDVQVAEFVDRPLVPSKSPRRRVRRK